jgi:hypothetical protein
VAQALLAMGPLNVKATQVNVTGLLIDESSLHITLLITCDEKPRKLCLAVSRVKIEVEVSSRFSECAVGSKGAQRM